MIKRTVSHAHLKHIKRALKDTWARKDVPEYIHMLQLLEEKPFYATKSVLPGHVSDNQPIAEDLAQLCQNEAAQSPNVLL